MSKFSRKDQEIREREAKILTFAREAVVREGYHGLNMDRIAEALDYSKGTIYNHFPCKEEILVALGIETMGVRLDLFRRAVGFAGPPRFQMHAVGAAAEVFARLYPDHFAIEHSFRMSTAWEKVSERRKSELEHAESNCMTLVADVVRAAIAQDQLTLVESCTAEDVVFGFWSLTSGAFGLAQTNTSLGMLGVKDPFFSVRAMTRSLADGLGWQPLSVDVDYDRLSREILEQVFVQESLQLATHLLTHPSK